MSLINQVLNELEKRGEDAPLGGAAIRAVPAQERRKLPLLLILAAGIAIAALAVLKWYLGRAEMAAVEQSMVMIAPKNGAAPVASGALAAASESVSAAVSAAAAGSSALNLSYELGKSAPAPAESLRSKPLLKVAQEEAPAPAVKKPVVHEPAANKVVEKKGVQPTVDEPETRQLKQISPQQHAENDFRNANLALQEGRANDALSGYEQVLKHDPLHHAARRALVGVLLGLKRNADAERVLQEGLKRDARESSFAMLLARLQVERDSAQALETLQKYQPYAEGKADYHAFAAALLQRQGRHKEAITHFQIALQLQPNSGVWLMGLGISLQAEQRSEDARDAFQRALASNNLDAQLQAFVQKKLKEL